MANLDGYGKCARSGWFLLGRERVGRQVTGSRTRWKDSTQLEPNGDELTRCRTWSAAAFLDQRSIADELQHIAKTLLHVQEDGAPTERRAVPDRLAKRSRCRLLPFPAPFVFFPDFFALRRCIQYANRVI